LAAQGVERKKEGRSKTRVDLRPTSRDTSTVLKKEKKQREKGSAKGFPGNNLKEGVKGRSKVPGKSGNSPRVKKRTVEEKHSPRWGKSAGGKGTVKGDEEKKVKKGRKNMGCYTRREFYFTGDNGDRGVGGGGKRGKRKRSYHKGGEKKKGKGKNAGKNQKALGHGT